MAPQYNELTPDQVDDFMQHGWIRIPQAFSREKAQDWTKDVWTRLGYSPDDKSTWLQERINMPHFKSEPLQTFSPKAWRAICDLLGGEERVDPQSANWNDGLIVNLGKKEYEGLDYQDPKELTNWHSDGDFFIHFLDSPEQGLLVIPLFSDIEKGAGGTMISPDGIACVAKHLHAHPQGVTPRMCPRDQEGTEGYEGLSWWTNKIKTECEEFVEMSGETGDVILMHPFMLHSASKNLKRNVRLITNPPVSLKQPFNYDRPDGNYSLVEKKTLEALGVDSLPGWKITSSRDQVIPERLKVQAQMKADEERRLRGEKIGGVNIQVYADEVHEIKSN